MDENTQLPCENCKLQTARCSTNCKRLHEFLRWTDKNRANIMSVGKTYRVNEITFDPETLTLISDSQISNSGATRQTLQDIFLQGIDHGALDLTFLEPHEIQLYEMYYIQQLSAQEIADMWRLTPHAVHNRLYRIRKKIKKYYLGKLIKNYPE